MSRAAIPAGRIERSSLVLRDHKAALVPARIEYRALQAHQRIGQHAALCTDVEAHEARCAKIDAG